MGVNNNKTHKRRFIVNDNGVKQQNGQSSQRYPPLGRGPSTYYNDEIQSLDMNSCMNGKNNARILNPKDISFHNGQNNNQNSMSPSKKLSSIGNPTSTTGTAQKD